MKSNYSIGTLGRSKAKRLLLAASALATFTFVQPVSAESSVLNRAGVYEQTIARPAWPHHVEVRFVTPRANGEHPAVIVAREFDEQHYDYQSSSPAWPHHVEVRFVTPRANGGHPAVIVAREFDKQDYDYQSKFYLHPAGLALSLKPPQLMSDEFTQLAGESKAAQ